MGPYRAMARAVALSAWAYRVNFLLGLGAVVFQMVALLAVWRVVLAETSVGGFTWPQMRAYLLIAFVSGTLVSALGDFRMAQRIHSGMVALDLAKPVDYQRARFAEMVGGLWLEIVVVALVAGVVVAVSGGIALPAGFALALFALSMLLMVPLKFLINYASTVLCFWTQNFIGVQWARVAVVNLFSGALIPLAFLPDWLAVPAAWSPFAGLTSTPALLFTGRVGAADGVVLVVVQLAWVVILWFGARLLWRVGLRRLTVNGG